MRCTVPFANGTHTVLLLQNDETAVAGGALGGSAVEPYGISGDTADNDELCALEGIAAAGLAADTGA